MLAGWREQGYHACFWSQYRELLIGGLLGVTLRRSRSPLQRRLNNLLRMSRRIRIPVHPNTAKAITAIILISRMLNQAATMETIHLRLIPLAMIMAGIRGK